jgi:hypothetical protein
MGEFTDAQLIASLHRHVIRIADGFDEALEMLIRDANTDRVDDVNCFVARDGSSGVRITITAEMMTPEEIAAETAKVEARRHG